MSLALSPQVASQTPQHFRSSETQAKHFLFPHLSPPGDWWCDVLGFVPASQAHQHFRSSETQAEHFLFPHLSSLGNRWCDVLGSVPTSQAPQHFRSSETQANCDGCFACQCICSVGSLHCGMSSISFRKWMLNKSNIHTMHGTTNHTTHTRMHAHTHSHLRTHTHTHSHTHIHTHNPTPTPP